MIKDDYENLVRLIHTVEKQIFDKSMYVQQIPKKRKDIDTTPVEIKIFELVDLFIRDSTLGQF